jgi:hypothetical protein
MNPDDLKNIMHDNIYRLIENNMHTLDDFSVYKNNINYPGLDTLKEIAILADVKTETEEEKVLRIVKCDFEDKFGITIERFQQVYESIVETSPEKLI